MMDHQGAVGQPLTIEEEQFVEDTVDDAIRHQRHPFAIGKQLGLGPTFEERVSIRVEQPAASLRQGELAVRGAVMHLAVEPQNNLLAVVMVKDAQDALHDDFKRKPVVHVLDLASGDAAGTLGLADAPASCAFHVARNVTPVSRRRSTEPVTLLLCFPLTSAMMSVY